MEQRLLQQRSEDARSTTQWSVAGYLAFTLGLSGLLAFFGRRELLRLSETYAVALKQQADDAEVLQEVAWLRSGQTRLAEQMIGQQALAPLGRSALDFLAHYLGVAVAALYVREDTGRLQRVAAYGFSKSNRGQAAVVLQRRRPGRPGRRLKTACCSSTTCRTTT